MNIPPFTFLNLLNSPWTAATQKKQKETSQRNGSDKADPNILDGRQSE